MHANLRSDFFQPSVGAIPRLPPLEHEPHRAHAPHPVYRLGDAMNFILMHTMKAPQIPSAWISPEAHSPVEINNDPGYT